jgi:hypothetical protein
MKCLICRNPTEFYFRKQFSQFGLSDVDYRQCPHCGFVVSETHLEMSAEEWQTLNSRFHRDEAVMENNPQNRPPPYFDQALMLHLLRSEELLENSQWLDWGAGSGKLSSILAHYFGRQLLNYDKYLPSSVNSVMDEWLQPRGFNVVVSSAVFEHVRSRDTLNEIESYVAPGGALAIHTLVRGKIPKDPNWMYLLAVHCAFHTNQSMEILMKEWGYTCSVYSELSKMWVLFREDPGAVQQKVQRINRNLAREYLHFKAGFMDYWP